MPQLFRIVDLQMGPRQNEAMNRYWLDNPNEEVFDAVDVGIEFADQHVDLVRIIQTTEWEHTALYVEDVLEPSNNALINLSGFTGVLADDTTPAFCAWSYAFKPVGPTIKRGGKRIPGVAEAWSDDEVVLPGGAQDAVEALALSFLLPIVVDSFNLNPAIVRAIGSPTPEGYLVSILVGAIFRQIGSQVSRKLSQGGGTSLGSLIGFSTGAAAGTDFSGLTPGDEAETINIATGTRPAVQTPYEVTRMLP